MSLLCIHRCARLLISRHRWLTVSSGTSLRATSLNRLGTSRPCVERRGICFWVNVWRSIYLPGAAELLLRVSGLIFFFFVVNDLSDICDSSKRIKDLAESHGFRGIIAGTRKTTPGIVACMVLSSCTRLIWFCFRLSTR
jgi:hypothetical protein